MYLLVTEPFEMADERGYRDFRKAKVFAKLAKLWRRTCGVTPASGESLKSLPWFGKMAKRVISSP